MKKHYTVSFGGSYTIIEASSFEEALQIGADSLGLEVKIATQEEIDWYKNFSAPRGKCCNE